jgi:hypothetical protein
VPFTIESSAGSNYFVKIINSVNNQPVVSFFVHGGQNLATRVPTVTFAIRDATGDKWCGEQNLFGTSTTMEEGTQQRSFLYGHIYRYGLTKLRDGNFPTKRVARSVP